MDTSDTLHIRCGSDIKEKLTAAGFVGDFLEFADPFCQGPFPATDGQAFIETRAAFLAGASYDGADTSTAKLEGSYKGLCEALSRKHIVLWFEHDSYDQLILAYVLTCLQGADDATLIELICIDDYPVKPRFIGLGQLRPDDLRGLWEGRVAVDGEHFTLARRVIDGLKANTPACLSDISKKPTRPILPMQAALIRHLQQLPHVKTGLSLTEELSLKGLANGAKAVSQLFSKLMLEDEPLPYLGDLMFWFELRALVEGGAVTILKHDSHWAGHELELSNIGRDLLAGETDWLEHVKTSRWIGGIEIKPGDIVWRRADDCKEFFLK